MLRELPLRSSSSTLRWIERFSLLLGVGLIAFWFFEEKDQHQLDGILSSGWIVIGILLGISGILLAIRSHLGLVAQNRGLHLGHSLRWAWIDPWICSVRLLGRCVLRATSHPPTGCLEDTPAVKSSFGVHPKPRQRTRALLAGLACLTWLAALGFCYSPAANSVGLVRFFLGILLAGFARISFPTTWGFGLREGMLLLLWRASGVSPFWILQTGCVLFGFRLLGTALGAVLYYRELRYLKRMPTWNEVKTLSVVTPVLNEAICIEETIRRVRQLAEVVELIVVDGGSQDATRDLAAKHGCRVLESPPGRGGQLRLGAQHATGDVILFLHADTWLPADAGAAIQQALGDSSVVAGGFWKQFRDPPLFLRGSRPKCWIRVFLGRRIVGDMAMFVRREALEQAGGMKDMEIMEDIEVSVRLRQHGRLALASSSVTTSARRFREKGVLTTYLTMWRVAWLYRLGKPASELRRIYGEVPGV